MSDLVSLYQQMHSKDDRVFMGTSTIKHAARIGSLIEELKLKSLLDYGCGKGFQYLYYQVHRMWHGVFPVLYDPGVYGLDELSTETFDGIICIDVLEHVEESSLPGILSYMSTHSKILVYLSISTRLAKKQLPNGQNAHVTVKSPEWWTEFCHRHLDVPRLELHFDQD